MDTGAIKRQQKRAIWRNTPCTKCGAPVGKRCRKRTFYGYVAAANPHIARLRAA